MTRIAAAPTAGALPRGRTTPAALAGGGALSRAAVQFGVLLLATLLLRGSTIGDPTYVSDEQFYLVVADRMWHGALPFVDVWDRKPIGLFLIYALFRPLSADGVVATQVAASCFALVTALVVVRMAARLVAPLPALLAGLFYLAYLTLLGGGAAQSPVFYNVFVAGAGLLLVRAMEDGGTGALKRNGLAAMLLVGLAMQVKYTALVEGVAFGLTLVWLWWRRGVGPLALGRIASLLVAAALLPTAVAFAAYAAAGHGRAFFDANFVSIFLKQEPPGFSEWLFLRRSAISFVPLVALTCLAAALAFASRPRAPVLPFLAAWSAAAFVEFFVIGHYYNHYALPLLVPAAVLVARLLAQPLAAGLVLGLTIACGQWLQSPAETRTQDRARIEALTAALAPYARSGCIYINDGPSILYVTTGSCLPTPYVFPSHLLDAEEARATDASAAMARLLRGRPSAIVVSDHPTLAPRNEATAAILARALAADYHFKTALPDVSPRNERIFVRNDLR